MSSQKLHNAAFDLIALNRFKQGLEVAFAKAIVTFALDEVKEDGPLWLFFEA